LPATGDIGGYVDYVISLPTIATSDTGLPLESSGSASFVDLSVNIVNVITTALSLPPLSGDVAGISYNVLSAGAGLDIGIFQNFDLTPKVHVRLDVQETGDHYIFDAGQNSPAIDPKGFTTLHVTPTFFMDGLFENNTGLQFTPYIFANGGSFSAAGVSVGPLFNLEYDFGTFPVTVFNTSFTLGGFNSITGPTFELVAAPEPGTLLLFGTGAAVVAVRRKRGSKARREDGR
jgi:hypothetical protein